MTFAGCAAFSAWVLFFFFCRHFFCRMHNSFNHSQLYKYTPSASPSSICLFIIGTCGGVSLSYDSRFLMFRSDRITIFDSKSLIQKLLCREMLSIARRCPKCLISNISSLTEIGRFWPSWHMQKHRQCWWGGIPLLMKMHTFAVANQFLANGIRCP